MPIIAWLLSKLTAKIALPILAVLLVTNIASGIGLAITRHTLADRTVELSAERLAHQADITNVKAQTAQAQADDQMHALAVKNAQDQITEEKQNDLQTQLVSARAIAARFVRSHAATASRGGQAASVSAAADTAGQPDSTPTDAVVSAADIDACAVDYTIAAGWRSWWKEVQPIMQAGAAPEISMAANRAFIPIDMAVRAAPIAATVNEPIFVRIAPVTSIARLEPKADVNQIENETSEREAGGEHHKYFLP